MTAPKIKFRVSKKHWLGRPTKEYAFSDVLRLTQGGLWVEDDGELGLAFSGLDEKGFPYAFAPSCDCFIHIEKCPGRAASDKTLERFGCSNGAYMLRPK